MWLSRAPAALALLAWASLAYLGRDENVPGGEWRGYYFLFPLAMALAALLLLVVSLRIDKPGPVGCSALLLIILLVPYIFFYTGGI